MSSWWDQIEPATKTLAKRLAARAGHGEAAMCLPYPMPHGDFTVVEMANLQPVWAQYVTTAREALAIRDDQTVDDMTGTTDVVTFTDPNPDVTWRKETGLDGEDEG